MHLYLDSIRQIMSYAKLFLTQGKIALQKGTFHGDRPSLAQWPSSTSSKQNQEISTAVDTMSCAKYKK